MDQLNPFPKSHGRDTQYRRKGYFTDQGNIAQKRIHFESNANQRKIHSYSIYFKLAMSKVALAVRFPRN